MNELGAPVLWWLLQVTALAIAMLAIFSLARRFGPAAGAWCATVALLAVLGGSLLAVSPWPKWGVAIVLPTFGAAIRTPPPFAVAELAQAAAEDSDLALVPVQQGSATAHEADQSAEAAPVTTLSFPTSRIASVSWAAWLASLLAAGACAGLIRLALGLAAVHRYRCTSLPIQDEALIDDLVVLQAEYSRPAAVEVRQSNDLVTPATIGWRRPLILLPADWRSWTGPERRAVLAHELAHIYRGDFAAGLLAQLCQAIHFYHPLVHLLAAELRLQQELAADAWAAQLAGGRQEYLLRLAGMAIRVDDRTAREPARSFLPNRGTFLRRIAMLRNPSLCRHVRLSNPLRWAVGLAVFAAGAAIVGVRGPAAADAPPGAAPTPLDLSAVPGEAKLFVAFRPAAASSRPEIVSLAAALREAFHPPGEAIPDMKSIDQVTLFAAVGGPINGIIVKGAADFDPVGWANSLDKNAAQTQAAGGTTLHATKPGVQSWLQVNDRTIIFGDRTGLGAVSEALGQRGAPAAWAELLKGREQSLALIAVDPAPLRNDLKRGPQGRPKAMTETMALSMLGPVLEATALVVSFDFQNAVRMELVGAFPAPAQAESAAATLTALKTLATNQLPAFRQALTAMPGPAGGRPAPTDQDMANGERELAAKALDLGEKFLSTVVIESKGDRLHVTAEIAADRAMTTLLPLIAKARTAARRSQAQNSLKQIGLAMHNYAQANGRFPPAVWYGGNGKAKHPHSWRVGLLPYIEADALYKQYNVDEPWDSPSNRKVLEQMPPLYRNPASVHNVGSNYASYFAIVGPGTVWEDKEGTKFSDITDGMSNTLLVVEANRQIPWTKPEDVDYDKTRPLPPLGGFSTGGFNALFADCSVRFLAASIDEKVLRAFITRAGGELPGIGN